MKKLLTIMAVGAVVATASADISGFRWNLGPAGSVATNTTIYTMLDANTTADMFAYVTSGQIDIASLALFSPYNSQIAGVAVAPPVNAGKWSVANIAGNGSIAGQYAYAVNASAATWGAITVGSTIKIFNVMGTIIDLQPGGTGTVALPQAFTPTSYQSVTVIPEPATALLFGIGAMGAWMIRRNKIRSKEQADA